MATQLPIVKLEVAGEQRLYYADVRLGEYRSIDGSQPWIIYASEVDGDMDEVIAQFSVKDKPSGPGY